MNGEDTYAQPIPNTSTNDINAQNQQDLIINQQVPPVVLQYVYTEFQTEPVSLVCQFCKSPITTNVKKSANVCAIITFILGVLFGIVGACVWICAQSCRKKKSTVVMPNIFVQIAENN